MPKVIHINDKVSIAGGVEVYISQLQPLLRDAGWESSWVGVKRTGSLITLQSDTDLLYWQGNFKNFSDSPLAKLAGKDDSLFHVHSLSEPKVLQELFRIAPVVRTMHEPRLFCPGQGKFLTRSERVCAKPFGLHCLVHAYTEKCCNRHPRRLWPAYQNVQFEVKQASRYYSRILANSTYIRDEAINAGIPGEKIILLHYFTPPALKSIAQHEEARILFIGRLSSTKGVKYLLQAMRSVLDSVPTAQLDLLGDGIDQQQCKDLAKELSLTENVRFHGWADREKIDHYLNRASVVTFPSIYPEAFGIVGIEAMMRGKPVVAFDVGGVKDWLEHEKTGLLIPVKDVQSFAQGLVHLLLNSEDRQLMGQNGRKKALEEFSSEHHLEKLTAIYREILGLN